MKIRRKLPKPTAAKPPAYVIGYARLPPSTRELKMWFDVEYGGPLQWSEAGDSAVASHTFWKAFLTLDLPPDDAARWAERTGWDYRAAGTVSISGGPRPSTDLQLHAARLARGITLLTQGTSFDIITGQHANPSDWTDRRLETFEPGDHIAVVEGDTADQRQWLFTKGLRKFGLDELEYFHPQGLAVEPIRSMLVAAAAEVILHRPSMTVGSIMPVPDVSSTLRIARHRTVSLPDGTLIVRELQRVEKSVT